MTHDFSLFFETDNEYWQKVLDIFAKNEKYEKKIVSNRNLHHKFPRSFSKKLGEPVDNDKDNLISLSLADHFLVHYYYYLLAKKGFRQAMATAFTFMAKKSLKYLTPETAEQVAKDYEEAQEIALQYISKCQQDNMKGNKLALGKHHSDEAKRKISAAHKGKTWEEIYGVDKARELKDKRNKGYTLIMCLETGEIHYYSEWIKILQLKSRSSLYNSINNSNKCCRKKHFVNISKQDKY